jgi:hypothetical protein
VDCMAWSNQSHLSYQIISAASARESRRLIVPLYMNAYKLFSDLWQKIWIITLKVVITDIILSSILRTYISGSLNDQ